MRKILSSCIISAVLISCQYDHAEANVEYEIASFHTIPFVLTSHNNISIQAIINKKDTVDLMFHTGTSSVTLTSEVIAQLKSVIWTSEQTVNSWGGESSARYSDNNSLEIMDLKWDSIPIWETQNSGPTTEGKFGPNLFEVKVIEIDFDENLMLIHDSLPSKIQSYTKVPLDFEDGNMFIEGVSQINGDDYKNRFLIHSGYGGTILFDDKFVADTKVGKYIDIIDEKELKDSYGNVLKTKKGILPLFAIGNTEFKELPIGFFEGTIGRQQMSVIGGDLIKRFNIILAADKSCIYLKANSLIGSDYTEFN